jgi:ATP-dependent helicase IRC3
VSALAVAPAVPTLALRPYQQEAIAAIAAAERRGVRRQLIALPTGTGKTVIFAYLMAEREGRALVIAHRDELISQAVEKLQLVNPSVAVGVVKAERDEHGYPVVVASVQTLARPGRLARLPLDFDTIVIDEAHHAAAETYRTVVEHFGGFAAAGPLVVGFTATPERGDGVGLAAVFQEIVYQRPMLDMMSAGYLCDLRAVQVQLRADFGALHVRAGDFIDSEVEECLLAANAPEHAVAAYQEHASGRKTILFTTTVRLAHAMAAEFRDAGIRAEALDGTTPLHERHAILGRLKSGATRVVANCAVLTEGFDEASVDCIVVARPTKSRPLYVQLIGRGTRPYPGKDDCLVLDLVGAAGRHEIQTTASLFGLDPSNIARRGVTEVLAERTAAQEAERVQGELVARTVGLFRARSLHWVHAGDLFLLSVGVHGQLALVPHGERWDVIRTSSAGERDIIASAHPLDYAMGIAEDRARAYQATALLDPAAPWRARPASAKQLDALRRFRIRIPAGLTAGEASDHISRAIASRNRIGVTDG